MSEGDGEQEGSESLLVMIMITRMMMVVNKMLELTMTNKVVLVVVDALFWLGNSSALWQHRDLQKLKNKKSKHQFEKFELQNQNIKQGPGLAIPYFPFLKKKLNLPH